MVKFQFEGLEAKDLRREQKIKKPFRETAKFQFYELEADDLRREQKIKKFSKETAKLESDDLKREQMRSLQEESRLLLRGFLRLLSKSCTYQNPVAHI